MRIKVIGAGSIGNHMAHASRSLGYDVVICDNDNKALSRTKNIIYPSRYKKWDKNIELYNIREVPKGNFDLIIIGTPPDTHIDIALEALKEKPKAILIEKPLCEPGNLKLNIFNNKMKKNKIKCFVGYNHCLAKSTNKFISLANKGIIGNPLTLDVEFREHWKGIFNAHPWLNGPQDTYLGFSLRGGGATGEHSHALNLWEFISERLSLGKVSQINAIMEFKIKANSFNYDELSFMNLITKKKFIGRVVQDVITRPTRKSAKLTGNQGCLELLFSYKKNHDLILINNEKGNKSLEFKKNRPDDFIVEMKYISDCIKNRLKNNSISLNQGIKTMKNIESAYLSNKIRKNVNI